VADAGTLERAALPTRGAATGDWRQTVVKAGGTDGVDDGRDSVNPEPIPAASREITAGVVEATDNCATDRVLKGSEFVTFGAACSWPGPDVATGPEDRRWIKRCRERPLGVMNPSGAPADSRSLAGTEAGAE